MKVDYCLILAAGFGTRMGLIGKSLPKVMWPIFEKTLLETQIIYARKFNPRKIYINVHHQADIVVDYFQKKGIASDVEFLFEPEIWI
jgi:mannose-1-phosphate guanylyltransferase